MFEEIFGKCIGVRILEAFLKKENRSKWMNLREVSRQSKLNSGTVSRSIDELVKNKIILEEKPSNWVRIFKLNKKNKKVQILIEFYDKILNTGK
ncbi:MAG: hypothetical protein QMC80_06670 [Thermoplasmatales archaeon]|nr:hypothetical protein [Thermoplasmatales archaeon]